MRTGEADILIVPGWSSSGEEHWQTRWERRLKTARRVEQADWLAPDKAAWIARIRHEIAASTRPVVIVAHSLGVIATVAALMDDGTRTHRASVAGAFLVAPADADHASEWPVTEGYTLDAAQSGFSPVPCEKLPCPSVLVASANDPYCRLDRAQAFAASWGSKLLEAGDCGHINAGSGHGPWPEGLLQLGSFLRSLGPNAASGDVTRQNE